MLRADGPFEICERVNKNSYKVNFPKDYGVLATFNMADLSPYPEDDHLVNLRANSPQQGEDNKGPSIGPYQEPQGTLEGLNSNSKVKEKVQALLNELVALPEIRDTHKFGSIYLLEGHLDGVISCTPHPYLA